MPVSELQFKNKLLFNTVRPVSPNPSTVANEVQLAKALADIAETVDGKEILVSEEQPLKQLEKMCVNPDGSVMEASDEQP